MIEQMHVALSANWVFRQHNDEAESCAEDRCSRPTYDGDRCKLHADLAAYRRAVRNGHPSGAPGQRPRLSA
jgi:hypothetical protein